MKGQRSKVASATALEKQNTVSAGRSLEFKRKSVQLGNRM